MIKRIYSYLPIFFQNILISIYGLYWHRRRYSGVFKRSVIKFKSHENYDKNQWDNYQTLKLRKLIVHSIKNVPYYSEKFKNINKEYLQNINLSEITKLPLLTKQNLRAFGTNTLLSKNRSNYGNFYSSSGSTGTPTKIFLSNKMHQEWSAGFEARIRHWAGISHKSPRGTIGGRRVVSKGNSKAPYYRYNLIEKQVYFSAYHISKFTVSDYLEGMFKHKIEYMTGYAMSNYFLAKFIEENNLKAPKLKAIITSSEKLTDEMRQTFKRVYGCKVYDSYSGVEMCGLISECEYGKLHISPDLGIMEIVKPNGEYALPGETGELICTGLLNYDQPLIRYKIGDEVTLSENQKCNCNREMPIIKEIVGRIEDTIIGPDGRKIVRFHNIFTNISKIVKGQIIQHTLKDFEVKLVASSKLLEKEKKEILNRMNSQLGKVKVIINEVSEIKENKNGKFQAVISKLK